MGGFSAVPYNQRPCTCTANESVVFLNFGWNKVFLIPFAVPGKSLRSHNIIACNLKVLCIIYTTYIIFLNHDIDLI